jgi:hypothetical protein
MNKWLKIGLAAWAAWIDTSRVYDMDLTQVPSYTVQTSSTTSSASVAPAQDHNGGQNGQHTVGKNQSF